ncbi:MAG: glutaminyl-peptide cyclotransferase [Sphingomonas sp.]|nr:glutaminyl-peptide cyclotransferase [Sphingomonas sp.]
MTASAAPVVSASVIQDAPAAATRSPLQVARVLATYPHDRSAFTQGLFFHDGRLFESTGQEGESAIRELDLATGKVKRAVRLAAKYFGEGSTDWGRSIVSLTWKHGKAFRWDIRTLRQTGQFTYRGEGWGLTQDGANLIQSDGSAALRFLDPATFAERRRVEVTWQGRPVRQLNELEYVRGEVLANIWHTNLIARIDPATGVIKGFLDLRGVAAGVDVTDPEAVLNGIAYDAKRGKLYVTGKLWPQLFEIALPED